MTKTIRKLETSIPAWPRRRRVAAYARVSSGKDAMLHSLSAQVSYIFKDGHREERIWQDKSRRDSWTDEMREQARRRNQK